MNKYNPLVSIVIPVYNGANYMREAIDSAINQTYDNLEIIVVNDGSTDNGETEKIALSYGDKIKYYKKENGGCASALNYGISKMQGEWFSWLSHDDVYCPEKIQSAVDCINEKEFQNSKAIVMCSSCVIDENGKQVLSRTGNNKDIFYTSTQMFNTFMSGKSLNGCALLIPKSALDEAGEFSSDYVYILDWIYWIELSLLGYGFYESREVLAKNRRHKEQVSVKKRDLLRKETEMYLLSLIDRLFDDEAKLQSIWLYCCQIVFKSGCLKVEKITSIPLRVRIKKFKRMLKHYIYVVGKKTLSLFGK